MKYKQINVLLLMLLIIIIIAPVSHSVYASQTDNFYFEVVSDFGFIEKDVLPEQEVTRGAFCDIIVKAADLPELEPKYTFSDVELSHPFSKSIYTLQAAGYVDGSGDGLFYPDDIIEREAAVKITAKAGGFDVLAKTLGGYSDGYMQYAYEFGILDGLHQEDAFTYKDAACIVYNMLMSERLIPMGGESYTTSELTMLEDLHSIYKYSGTVVSDEYTSLNGNSICGQNEIVLRQWFDDDMLISVPDGFDYDKYLGRNVTVYVKNIDEGFSIEAIIMGKNDEVSIDATDIHAVLPSKIQYCDKDGDVNNVDISKYADIIYNGKAHLGFSLGDINSIKNGSVKCVDNDSDGLYDIVFVHEYKNIIVKAVDAPNDIIFDMSDNMLCFDEVRINGTINITMNNEKIAIADLQKWDVVSIAESADGLLVRMYVTRKTIRGDVTGLTVFGNESVIYIDNKEYKSAFECYNKNEIQLNAWGVFCFDAFGRIAAFDVRSNENVYGFLINAAREDAMSDKVSFKVFTQAGQTVVYNASKTVKFNEQLSCSGAEVLDALKALGGGNVIPQMIRYDYTNDGRITKLSVAQNNDDEEKFVITESMTRAQVMKTRQVMTFASKYIVNSSSVIFCVPEVVDGKVDTEILQIMDESFFATTRSYDNLKFYDVDETRVAGLLTYVVGDSVKKYGNDIACIEKISSVITNSGEEKTLIQCVVEGAKKTYYWKNSNNINNCSVYGTQTTRAVRSGDVVRFALNSLGEVEEARIFASCSDAHERQNYEVSLEESNSFMNASIVVCCGTLDKVGDYSFTLLIHGFKSDYNFPTLDNTKMYKYSASDKTFDVVSSDYLAGNSGREVFVLKEYGFVSAVVILETE